MNPTEIKKAFIFYCPTIEDWLVTIDEEEVQQYEYYLASVEELREYVALCGHVFQGQLRVKEGICQWYERGSWDWDSEEDYECGYELIEEVVA